MQNAVSGKEKLKGQLHKVFEESLDAKSIGNKKFFLQKFDYIHLNPACTPQNVFPLSYVFIETKVNYLLNRLYEASSFHIKPNLCN